jgi:hypothetical protein
MYHQDYDFGVNLSEIQDMDSFEPVPAGEYQVQAIALEVKNAKTSHGRYLQFEFVISQGTYANRKLFQNVIIQHLNQDAQRIGLQWLKSWILACNGLGNERLTLSLVRSYLNVPCIAKVVIEEGKAGYSARNKVQKFKKLSQGLGSEDDLPF